jgi:hypothetical protein
VLQKLINETSWPKIVLLEASVDFFVAANAWHWMRGEWQQLEDNVGAREGDYDPGPPSEQDDAVFAHRNCQD